MGMPVQVKCTPLRPEQLKILHHRNNYSDSTLTTPETEEELVSQNEGTLQQVVKQLIQMLKRKVREETQGENHTFALCLCCWEQ